MDREKNDKKVCDIEAEYNIFSPIINIINQPNIKEKLNKLWKVLSILFLIVAVSIIFYFIIFPSRGEINSDLTDTVLWAQASWKAKAIFDPDFFYACLMPFGGQLFMLPFVARFGISFTSHILGMLVFCLVFTLALWKMLRNSGISRESSSFYTALILLSISGTRGIREIFWGHIIYYSLGMLFTFVGLSLIFKVMKLIEEEPFHKKKIYVYLLVILLWNFLTATNMIESISLFNVPVIAAFIAERFFSVERPHGKKRAWLLVFLLSVQILGTGIGYLVGKCLRIGFTSFYATYFSQFSSSSEWGSNASKFLIYVLEFFGVCIKEGDAIASLGSILNICRIIFVFMFLFIPIIAFGFYRKIKSKPLKIMMFYNLFMNSIIMIGFIFGRLSDSDRKVSTIICSSIIVTYMICHYAFKNIKMKRIAMIPVVIAFILCMVHAVNILQLPKNYKMDDSIHQVINDLKDLNLTYGYATFWNANVTTMNTGEKIKVRSIILDGTETGYDIYPYQTQLTWYKNVEGQEDYFLLLEPDEYYFILANAPNTIFDALEDIVISEGYHVLIYDHNLF